MDVTVHFHADRQESQFYGVTEVAYTDDEIAITYPEIPERGETFDPGEVSQVTVHDRDP